MKKIRVLFVCVGNTARSQMAEAFLQTFGGDRFEVMSAGFEPGRLNPYVVASMQDLSIDISHKSTKSVFTLFKQSLQFDFVISVCDGIHAQKCPVFPGKHTRLSWSFDDPATFVGEPSEILAQVAVVRDEIKERILSFLKMDHHTQPKLNEMHERNYEDSLVLQLLFNQIKCGVAIVDRNFTIQQVNAAFTSMFHLSESQALGRPLFEILPSNDFFQLLERYNHNKVDNVRYEHAFNGTYFQLDVSKIDFGDGNIKDIITFTDITESKKAMELAHYNQFIQSVIDSLPHFVIINDRTSINFANKSILQFLEFDSLSDLNANHDCICDFFDAQDGYVSKRAQMLAIIDAPADQRHLAIMQGKIYEIHIDSLTANPLQNIVTLTDVSALETLNATLEQRIKDAVVENESQRIMLFQQAKQAQIGEMINLIVHQWRQPLNVLSIVSQTIYYKLPKTFQDDPVFTRNFEKIDELIQHLDATLDDFRNFFKPDRNKTFVTAHTLIESALKIADAVLKRNNIQIITINTSKKELFVFPNELKHVFLNLIKNSEEALLDAKIENPMIQIESFDAEDGYHIKFSDNGPGIDPTLITNVFDPYVSSKSSENGKGSGLGLYMSKLIVAERCNGEISASSSDHGACFEIILPNDQA